MVNFKYKQMESITESDFAVFDDNEDIDFLIEYQGIQHYEPKSKFGGIMGLKK